METGKAAVTYTPRRIIASTMIVQVSHFSRLLALLAGSEPLLEDRRCFAKSELGRKAFIHFFRVVLSPGRNPVSTSAMEKLLLFEDRGSLKVVSLLMEPGSLCVGPSTAAGPRGRESCGNMLQTGRTLAIQKRKKKMLEKGNSNERGGVRYTCSNSVTVHLEKMPHFTATRRSASTSKKTSPIRDRSASAE